MSKIPCKRLSIPSSDTAAGNTKRIRVEADVDNAKSAYGTPASSRSGSPKVRGVERIPLDRIPVECIGSSDAAQRHRLHFFLRQKTRLLSQGKLVIPGKGMCKLLPDGATLEWESIGMPGRPSTTQKEELAAKHEGNFQLVSAQEENSSRGVAIFAGAVKVNPADDDLPLIFSMDTKSGTSGDDDVDELELSDWESNDGQVEKPYGEMEAIRTAIHHSGVIGSSLAAPIVISDDEDKPQPHSSRETPHKALSSTKARRIWNSPPSDSSDDVSTSSRSVSKAGSRKSHPISKGVHSSKQIKLLGREVSYSSRRGPSNTQPGLQIVTLRKTEHVPVPKATWTRGRRILVQKEYLVTVSMRGDLQYFNVCQRDREKSLSAPWNPQNGKQHVEDACSVDGYGVIAFNSGPSQVVIVDGTQQTALKEKPHKMGLSCVSPVEKFGPAIKFLSGGHDNTVRLWTVDVSLDKFSTKVEKLGVYHGSLVHALAYIPTKKQVVSASNRKVSLHDIEKCTKVKSGPSSNTIFQIHVQHDQPNVMATEVNHLDRQINIYDLRQGFTEKAPTLEMGYRAEDSCNPWRYERGAFQGSLFTRGYRDGTIKIFDIRNPKSVVSTVLTRRESPVEHTIFWEGTTVAAFGSTMLSFLDFRYS